MEIRKYRSSRNRQQERGCARAGRIRCASNGIVRMLRVERSAWIHCGAALVAVGCGVLCGLSLQEWIAVVFCIGGVFAAEAFNTAIETLADRVSPEYDELIKHCKDAAAGAVLIFAFAAGIVGLLVFVPRFISWLEI